MPRRKITVKRSSGLSATLEDGRRVSVRVLRPEHDDESDTDSGSSTEVSETSEAGRRLTSRQRSIQSDVSLLEHVELPSTRKKKRSTKEDELKRSEKARKRKLLSIKMEEEEKRAAVEKLLNKSTSSMQKADKAKRIRKIRKEMKSRKVHVEARPNHIRYQTCTVAGDTPRIESVLCIPSHVVDAFSPMEATPPAPRETCGVGQCSNESVYRCPKTNTPFCSLPCFRKITS